MLILKNKLAQSNAKLLQTGCEIKFREKQEKLKQSCLELAPYPTKMISNEFGSMFDIEEGEILGNDLDVETVRIESKSFVKIIYSP